MLIRICSHITAQFIKKGMLQEDLADWCVYWLQKRIITFLAVLLMFIIGSLIYGSIVTASFLFGLLPLRRRLHGFHTKTPHACMIMSVSVMLVALRLNSFFTRRAALIFSILNFGICFLFVVSHRQKYTEWSSYHSNDEMTMNYKLSNFIVLLVSVVNVTVAILFDSVKYASGCQLGITVVVLSSIYAKIIRDRSCAKCQKKLRQLWGTAFRKPC